MGDVFAGLEALGFSDIENIDIYEEEKKEVQDNSDVTVQAVEERDYEAEVLFQKTIECPCCYNEFKYKAVRSGKLKAMEPDTDLRPRFEKVDVLKYDAIVCPKCGYSGLTRYFDVITEGQKKLVREQVTASFKGIDDSEEKLSYDDAILRHKLCLLNAVVKKGKFGEKAYISLKMAWLFRGKIEETLEKDSSADVKELRKEELTNLKNAYDGFYQAIMKESMPICGMDQDTITYLMAELARKLGQTDVSKQWLSKLLSTRGLSRRLKERAMELKEKLLS